MINIYESFYYELIKYELESKYVLVIDSRYKNMKDNDRYLSSVLLVEFKLCSELKSLIGCDQSEFGCNKCKDYLFTKVKDRLDLINS